MPGDFSGGGAAFADLRPAMHSWHTALTLPPDTIISALCCSKQAPMSVHLKSNRSVIETATREQPRHLETVDCAASAAAAAAGGGPAAVPAAQKALGLRQAL